MATPGWLTKGFEGVQIRTILFTKADGLNVNFNFGALDYRRGYSMMVSRTSRKKLTQVGKGAAHQAKIYEWLKKREKFEIWSVRIKSLVHRELAKPRGPSPSA